MVLGLPDGVTACLFDLDGVLTDTAAVHNAAWKQTFDEVLRERAERGGTFQAVRPQADYLAYVDGKPREDGVRDFLASRGIELPEGTPDDPPGAARQRVGNRKNRELLRRIREDGVEVFEGSRRYLEAARDAGLRRAVVSSSANTKDVLAVTGLDALIELRVDGVTIREENLAGKPAPDTFLTGRGPAGVKSPAVRRCSRTRSPGCRPAGPVGLPPSSASIGSGMPRRCASTVPTSSSATSPNYSTRCRRDRAVGVPGRAVGGPGDRARPRPAGAVRVGVRAVERAHRAARQPRRGRAARHPGHVPQLVLRAAPAALRRGRATAIPESGQTVVNVTNGKLIRLLVDDEPFDVRYGELRAHERVLDLRAGTLTRDVEWVSPAGNAVRVRSTRLVSFTQRAVAAIEYEVEPVVDQPARLILQSELVANEELPRMKADPRVTAILDNPLVGVEHSRQDNGGILLHHTRSSELSMAAGMDHIVDGHGRLEIDVDSRDDWARTTVVAQLKPGERLRIVKLLAYGWSSLRSRQSLRDQVAAALSSARYSGWEGLLDEQRAYLDDFWDRADVEVDGDPEIQQAVRFGLFHVLQAGARAERRAIPAKGLTGPGYDGHTFWDTEGFVLPVLTYTQPSAAADALRWRHSTLDLAKERAQTLGLQGAAFPWRTIRGQECSGYWPAGTAAFHINADIADAVERYRNATGDDSVDRSGGVELLVETARLWMSLGHHDADGAWHVDGVTGPDEYSAIADDNVFTNLMAARNLLAAAEACIRHPDQATTMGVSTEETAAWRDAADAVHIPYDEKLGVHPQSEGYTRHESGTSRPTATGTRCCCTRPTSTCIASRSSSRPTSCWRCTGAATGSRPRTRRETSTTTSGAPSGTRRCRPAPRRCWRPRSATSSWRTTTPTRPR